MNHDEKIFETAGALDKVRGFHFRSKKPEIVRKVTVKERTPLPAFLVVSLCAAFLSAGWLVYGIVTTQQSRSPETSWMHTTISPIFHPPTPPKEKQTSATLKIAEGKASKVTWVHKDFAADSRDGQVTITMKPRPAATTPSAKDLRTKPTVRGNVAEVDGQAITR